MKKAVILMGAGAAVAWDGPLTSKINEKLFADKQFMTRSGKNLARFIFDQLTDYYKGIPGTNFETIINVLEALYDHYMNKTTTGTGPSFIGNLPHWFDVNGIVHELINMEVRGSDENCAFINKATNDTVTGYPKVRAEAWYFGSAIREYISIICREIVAYDDNYEKKTDLNRCMLEWYSFLEHRGYVVRTYTTNYDRILPKLRADVFDGFDEQVAENSFAANIPRILLDDKMPCFYNLHGSIFWDYNSNNKHAEYQFCCTPKEYHCSSPYNFSDYSNPGTSTHMEIPLYLTTLFRGKLTS